MPKTKKDCVILTRVPLEDMGQCREIALSRRQSISSLAREALSAHLANIMKGKIDILEGPYAQQLKTGVKQLKSGVDRICGFLYKIAKYSLATFLFLERMDPELMKGCLETAVKMIGKGVQTEEDEEVIPQAMSLKIRGNVSEISSEQVVPV